jgi:DNA replication protein DnaC
MLDNNATLQQLEELKLNGMAEAYRSSLDMPLHDLPSAHELMAHLVQAEKQHRSGQRTHMYLKLSNLRYDAVLEQIECSASRNLTRQQLLSLADCSFVARAENILITGATGCGKSYLACAIGRQACSLGIKTTYLGMNRLVERITLAKLDGSYIKLLNHLEKIPLIIIDDFGLIPMDHNTRLTLLQLLEDRYGRRSTIITSQFPVSKWYETINEPTFADAIMDRLSASAHRIELKGESLRRKKTE